MLNDITEIILEVPTPLLLHILSMILVFVGAYLCCMAYAERLVEHKVQIEVLLKEVDRLQGFANAQFELNDALKKKINMLDQKYDERLDDRK